MKKLILLMLIASCGSRHSATKQHPSDTLYTVRTFVAFPDPTVKFDAVYRVTKDTFEYKDLDSLTKTKQWSRDTTYFIPIQKTDTTKRDSTGKFIQRIEYTPTLKGSVYEGEDLMAGIKQLAKWIEDHKQYWPKLDTTVKK